MQTSTLLQQCAAAQQFADEARDAFEATPVDDPDLAVYQELWLTALADLKACRAAITAAYNATLTTAAN